MVLLSVAFGALFYLVLLQKQLHTDLMARKSEQLVEQARKAALNERELNEFLAHEVRNPLSAALSAATFVAYSVEGPRAFIKDPEAKKAVIEDVKIIDSSLRFINELLRSLLDCQKAAANQMTLDATCVDVNYDIFEPVKSMIYARDSNFTVVIECPQGLVVCADKLRLQQIILNLGRNASKFVESGYIRLRADVVNDSVHLYVEDSGPGIPVEKQNQLFNRFQESLDSLKQGTGVGLNLCKQLVTLMNGEIWCDESFHSGIEGHQGTRIIIDLNRPPEPIDETLLMTEGLEAFTPCLDKKVTGTGSTTSRSSSVSGDGHQQDEINHEELQFSEELSVLFVDDDRILRKLASRSIGNLQPSWKVREAASGETALQLAEEEHFDIIFMDQYMTSVDQSLLGTATVRALRAKGVESVICGLSANDLDQMFKNAGADLFLMKPFPAKQEELKTAMTKVLQARTARRNFDV
jgi:signal transduction histidine kinase/ActR/RegA family two-component response regulator